MDTQETSDAQTNRTKTAPVSTEPAAELEDMEPAVKAIVPGTMSGAERVAYWGREGVFETFAYLNNLIWPRQAVRRQH